MLSFFKKGTKEKDGKLQTIILLLGAALGITLLLFGGFRGKQQSNDTQETASVAEEALIRYQDYLESRIRALCESMGYGSVFAIVTLEGDFEEVYATEWVDGNEAYVTVGKGSSAEALPLSRKAPEIMGIGIVFRAPISDARHAELLSLISSAFHTSTNRIYITSSSP